MHARSDGPVNGRIFEIGVLLENGVDIELFNELPLLAQLILLQICLPFHPGVPRLHHAELILLRNGRHCHPLVYLGLCCAQFI